MIENVIFLGSKSFGLKTLECLNQRFPGRIRAVITLDDRTDARSQFNEMARYCEQEKLPFHVAKSKAETKAMIQELRPDLCFVNGWYWLLDQATLDLSRHGFVGIHNSLLPRYRGGAPLVWALINGEAEVGSSLFYFTQGMDDGDILAQVSTKVEAHDNIATVADRLESLFLAELPGHFQALLDGTARRGKQDPALATYCGQRRAEDGEIDWSEPAEKVHNFIRAQAPPYPGAFTYFGHQKIKITDASCFPAAYAGRPGQILRVLREGVYVACGEHSAIIVVTVMTDDAARPAHEVLSSVAGRLGPKPFLVIAPKSR